MTHYPSEAEIQELISFLGVFRREGFDPVVEWRSGELLPDGVGTFPWPVYQEEVIRFFRLAGRECWSDYAYLANNAAVMLQDPDTIKNATLDQIRTMLTFCVRGERFCDGFWGEVIQEGKIQRLLERLEILQDEI